MVAWVFSSKARATLHGARVLAVACLAALLAAGPSWAQTKVSTTVGTEKVVVAGSAVKFEKIEAPALGEIFTRSNAKGDKHDLIYRAPDKVPDAPVPFTYTPAGGQPVKVEVTVDSGATPEPESVMVGTQQVLVRESTVLITKDKAVLGQVAVTSAGDPPTYDLVYTAPKVGVGKKDEVAYTIGEKDYKVSVALRENIWGTGYEAAFKVLFTLFVLAVILELGLAVLFNWRYFLRWFDAAGLKTVITVLVAYWFVRALDLDIIARLVNVLWMSSYSSDFVSRLVSALVLAGGSATVNTLMVALGFRAVRTAESVQRKPAPTDAWLAVLVSKDKVERAEVGFETTRPAPQPQQGAAVGPAPPLKYALLARLNKLWPARFANAPFIRNPGRFPGWGGYVLQPGTEYTVVIQGVTADGTSTVGNPVKRGPFTPAPGAIIDIHVTL